MKKILSNLTQKKLTSQIVMIFSMALLLRFLVLVYVGGDVRKFYTFDSSGYVTRAQNLMNYSVFSGEQTPPFTLDMERTPIYPLFIGTILVVFGNNFSVVIFLQILLGSITAVLTFYLAKELGFSTLTGLISTGIVALDPVSILLNNRLLTETLFTFELVLGIWLLVLFWHKNKIKFLILSAIIISLSALTRPIAQFLPLALFPLLILARKGKSLRIAIREGLIFIFICGIILSTWSYRNYKISNRFMLSTISDINLIYYRARAVFAKVEDISQDEAKERLEEEIKNAAVQQNLTQFEIISLQRKRALQIFSQYPVQTIAMLGKGAGRLLIDPGFTIICTMLDTSSLNYECFQGESTMLETGLLNKILQKFKIMTFVQQLALVWGTILIGIIYFGLAGGVIQLILEKNWLNFLLLGILILYFVLLSAGGEANYRFRAPIQPFLAILSGTGYGAMCDMYNRRHLNKTI